MSDGFEKRIDLGGNVLPGDPNHPLLEPLGEEDIAAKLEATPASVLLYGLVATGHGQYITSLQHRLEHRDSHGNSGLSEDDYARIFQGSGPDTLEEEEWMHIVNLRGALMSMTACVVDYPTIPAHFKQEFGQQIGTNWAERGEGIFTFISAREKYINSVQYWGFKQPNFDPRFKLDETTRPKVSSIATKADALMNFYRTKRPLENMSDFQEHQALAQDYRYAKDEPYPVSQEAIGEDLRIEFLQELRTLLDPSEPLPSYTQGRADQ